MAPLACTGEFSRLGWEQVGEVVELVPWTAWVLWPAEADTLQADQTVSWPQTRKVACTVLLASQLQAPALVLVVVVWP